MTHIPFGKNALNAKNGEKRYAGTLQANELPLIDGGFAACRLSAVSHENTLE